MTDSFVGYAIADVLARSLIAPLSGLAAAILYFELRRLHGEGGPAAPAAPPTQTPAPPAGPEAPTA